MRDEGSSTLEGSNSCGRSDEVPGARSRTFGVTVPEFSVDVAPSVGLEGTRSVAGVLAASDGRSKGWAFGVKSIGASRSS